MLLFTEDSSEETQYRELIFNLQHDTHISDWLHNLKKSEIKHFYQQGFTLYFLLKTSKKLKEIGQDVWYEAFEEIINEKY